MESLYNKLMESLYNKLMDEIIHANNNVEAVNECEKICEEFAKQFAYHIIAETEKESMSKQDIMDVIEDELKIFKSLYYGNNTQ